MFPTTSKVAVGLPSTAKHEENDRPWVIAVGDPDERNHVSAGRSGRDRWVMSELRRVKSVIYDGHGWPPKLMKTHRE